MKLQYHKINNIDKSVCTCEQMIAYNLAFDCYINYNFINEYKAQTVTFYRHEIVFEFIHKCMQSLTNALKVDAKLKRYNVNAIQCALNAGTEKYINSKYHILNNYADIGKMFPAEYL